MDAELIFGAGVAERLADTVDRFAPRRVLVVAGPRAVAQTGVLERLAGRPVHVFAGFSANPVLPDVLAGCRVLADTGADLVVGIGGGSAMDTAKLIRLLPGERARALDVLAGPPPDRTGPPLIVVPTTAGTGSEVTQFATLYVDGLKRSLDTPAARPDVALVDPLLTGTCPAELTLSCAFDALAHALESYWSTRSTAGSRWLALSAGRGLAEVLGGWPRPVDRTRMSELAIQAGLAINQTRTTVGHAFAYPLTVRHGIPHGLAAALALAALLPAAVAGGLPLRDARGPEFVGRRLQGLADILGAPAPDAVADALRRLLSGAGFATGLGSYGMRPGDVDAVVRDALSSGRAGNAPFDYDAPAATRALHAAL